MKKSLLLVVYVITFVLAGCEPNIPTLLNGVITGDATEVTCNSVVLHVEVNDIKSAFNEITDVGLMISDVKEDLNPLNYRDCYFDSYYNGYGEYSLEMTNLSPETQYYYCAVVTCNHLHHVKNYRGEIKTFTTLKEDSTKSTGSHVFSIGKNNFVTFSPGNLQYHPANDEWRFAPSQLDYIGDANSNCSSTYNGWLDLFGWSTRATNFGVSTSKDDGDYSGLFVDWGTNKIGNDAPHTWRTLTDDEWNYIFHHRYKAKSLCFVAQVDRVRGLLLLPNNWICPEDVNVNNNNIFTAAHWSKLEASGAVFLPAAGYRYGSYVNYVQDGGYYWFATDYYDDYAYYLYFRSVGADVVSNGRDRGRSVRLVKDL